ncbi:MAG: hypothetical protein D6680_09200 [Cyanobacteria bacterium J007]|nr:MAG: hypothetical protein D6680_09200 [Cyanobacteria bacterium J007]
MRVTDLREGRIPWRKRAPEVGHDRTGELGWVLFLLVLGELGDEIGVFFLCFGLRVFTRGDR